MNEYIDVRGVWPLYIKGLIAYQLTGFLRSVTLEVARREYNQSLGIDVLYTDIG